MEYIKTSIEGVWVLKPKVFKDARGYFVETYQKSDFDPIVGRDICFIQDTLSMSKRGVVRGLHYQKG